MYTKDHTIKDIKCTDIIYTFSKRVSAIHMSITLSPPRWDYHRDKTLSRHMRTKEQYTKKI